MCSENGINGRRINSLLLIILFLCVSAASRSADFSIEDYGVLPKYRSITISPDGKHYALIGNVDGEEAFYIVNFASESVVAGARLGNIKARDVYFATNRHVILVASDTISAVGYRGRFEGSAAYVLDLSDKRLKVLLNRNEDLYPAQSGLGRIIGLDEKREVVFMPASVQGSFPPARHLFKVRLSNGKAAVYRKGNPNTRDWFVGKGGRVLARIDYLDKRKMLRIFSYLSGESKLIYERLDPNRKMWIRAVSPGETELLFIDDGGVQSLSLNDGAISNTNYVEPTQAELGKRLDNLKTDINRKIISINYSGLLPTEVLVDKNLDAKFASLQVALPQSHLQFMGATQDREKIVARVSGNQSSGGYLLFDSADASLKYLGKEYPSVSSEQIGEIATVAYKARDGLRVPSVITWPVGSSKTSRQNLPLLVFPHGGPASYDYIQFNWWAQYFARKGYLVLQPNFRGSAGFGVEHQEQGLKQWGRAMQNDVSDGVKALVAAGHVDPKRVCIMGSSYGGYAALAGGAFSPELYRCVISVAGVTDLPDMLSYVKRKNINSSWVLRYWETQMGDSKSEREKLTEVSPARRAEGFAAPVLLIHGKDDIVVPLKQSKMMRKALKKAGKNVELVVLKGEDHWLSKSETRLGMLKAIDAFLDKHNPI